MQTHEIARREWRETLDALSRDHFGELVAVEVDAPELGAHADVLQLPLVGVSLEGGPRAQSIAIAMGRVTDRRVTQLIERPVRLSLECSGDDADAGLAVESADHTRTLVRFRRPAPTA